MYLFLPFSHVNNNNFLFCLFLSIQGEEEDAKWTIDVSAEAVKQRQLDLTDGVKNLTMNDDLEKTEKVIIQFLFTTKYFNRGISSPSLGENRSVKWPKNKKSEP